jgi:P-type Cu2+ transporter
MPSPDASSILPGPGAKPGFCIHCGNPLDKFHKEEDGPFCCAGCRTVYHLIQGEGLDRYYDLKPDIVPPASELRSDSYAWLDSVLDSPEAETGPISLDIQGVHCAACVWLIEEMHERELGDGSIRINPSLGKVDLSWNGDRDKLKRWLSLIEKFGYRFGPSRKRGAGASRALLVRMGVSIAIAMNVMIFSISYYFGLSAADGLVYHFFGWVNFALATLSVLVGGTVFMRAAWQGLRRRVAHLDLPISLGIILAYGGSALSYFLNGPEAAYFDTLAIFVALMLVGRWTQERILERNRNALLEAEGVENLFTRRYRDDTLESAPATDLLTGDELWIAPGDLLPVEAILMRRPAELALDWITGESEKREYQPGDRLPAGAFNAGRAGFRAAAGQDFAESRLNDLLRSPAGTQEGGMSGAKWWHRVSSIYVAAVLILAAGAFLMWMGRDLQKALEVTVAVLVVTCPCALGLATPLAHEMIQSALRRRGVLIRRSGFFDRALAVRKVLFDKTGTLTAGKLSLTDDSRQNLDALNNEAREALYNMASRSLHPVSRALATEIGSATLDSRSEDLIEYAGMGLEWKQGDTTWRLGRSSFCGGAKSDDATCFSRNGDPLAGFHFQEAIRPGATTEIATLSNLGYELHLLSGDSAEKVAAAAPRLGIDLGQAIGGLTPEAKADKVRELDSEDTLMVGDGLNDAPSFEAAHCSATPAVDHAALPGKADFYYLGDGISALRRALIAAHKLRGMIKLNLIFASVYNLGAVILSILGYVSPLVAAILMPISSVLIVSYTAWRLSGRRLRWMS